MKKLFIVSLVLILSFTITITTSHAQNLRRHGTAAFSIRPNAEYRKADVLVDGNSVGPVTTYRFANVTAAHTIAATFTALDAEPPTGNVTINGNAQYANNQIVTLRPSASDDSGVGFVTDENALFTTANVLANDTDPDIGDTVFDPACGTALLRGG